MKQKLTKHILSALPQNTLSRTIGKAARSKFSKTFIKPYSKIYKINLDEIEKPLHEYQHMTDFFTRKLASNARTISSDQHAIISPVDGTLSQFGHMTNGGILQAKGISYTTEQLLGSKSDAHYFKQGTFFTLYLSPRDYHRIHMPIDGHITHYTYIPGSLFPVNSIGVNEVNGLFTKNERLISLCDTKVGKVAIVKVGAFIVGSVKVGYDQITTNQKKASFHTQTLSSLPFYQKGEEVGLFEFGSTVILLFEHQLQLSDLRINDTIKMGQNLAFFH